MQPVKFNCWLYFLKGRRVCGNILIHGHLVEPRANMFILSFGNPMSNSISLVARFAIFL